MTFLIKLYESIICWVEFAPVIIMLPWKADIVTFLHCCSPPLPLPSQNPHNNKNLCGYILFEFKIIFDFIVDTIFIIFIIFIQIDI